LCFLFFKIQDTWYVKFRGLNDQDIIITGENIDCYFMKNQFDLLILIFHQINSKFANIFEKKLPGKISRFISIFTWLFDDNKTYYCFIYYHAHNSSKN